MRYIIIGLLMLFVVININADVVQIATTRDATGNWNNWLPQMVTWDTTVIAITQDHYAMSYKALQAWMFPVEGGYIKATFKRLILGEYAIRWSIDGELWSDANSVIILSPKTPKAGK